MNRPSRLALGASFLATLGQGDLESRLVAALELGFDGVLPAPSARPLPWRDAPALLERLPIGVPAIRVESPFDEVQGTLASQSREERGLVHERVAKAAALGRLLDCNVLILEAPLLPGTAPEAPSYAQRGDLDPELRLAAEARLARERDRHLEHACRGLYELVGAFAEFRICLTESARLASLSGAHDLRLLLEELPRQPCGYWHRASLAARRQALGGAHAGEGLDQLSKFLVGMDLEDASSEGIQELPGTGNVDYALLAPYVRRSSGSLPTALEPGPRIGASALPRAVSFLQKFGLQAGGAA